MQVQRTIKTNVYRLVNKVNVVVIVLRELQQLMQHHRAVSKRIEIVKRFIAVLIFRSF